MLTHTSCATCGGSLVVPRSWGTHGNTHDECPQPTDRVSVLTRAFLHAAETGDDATADQLAAELDATADRPPRLLDAALAYVAWGWPVFPCRPGHKTPAIPRTHGGHGLQDATTDPERVRDWWWRWPHANIGLPTGHAFDVIDIDPAGRLWWANLVADHSAPGGPLPDIHGIASTPRGQHIYVEAQGKGNLAGLHEGVDYRGLGGYVLGPPSALSPAAYSGKGRARDTPATLRYAWSVYPSPWIKPATGDAA